MCMYWHLYIKCLYIKGHQKPLINLLVQLSSEENCHKLATNQQLKAVAIKSLIIRLVPTELIFDFHMNPTQKQKTYGKLWSQFFTFSKVIQLAAGQYVQSKLSLLLSFSIIFLPPVLTTKSIRRPNFPLQGKE